MPIECPEGVRAISQEEFYDADYKVMGLVFGIHNELGRLWDERVYKNELAFRRGGEEKVARDIEIVDGPRVMGSQRTHLLSPSTAFRLSAVTRDPAAYEQQLRKFLSHTRLRTLQWISLDHHTITLKTLAR